MIHRLQNEVKGFDDAKDSLRSKIDHYEAKIQNMIKEFEAESKKHIKEVNDVHHHYREFKTKSKDMDS